MKLCVAIALILTQNSIFAVINGTEQNHLLRIFERKRDEATGLACCFSSPIGAKRSKAVFG